MTSSINGKNPLSNCWRRRAPPTEPERDQTTDILTDDYKGTQACTYRSNTSWLDQVWKPPRQVEWVADRRKNYCGLANGNSSPHLQKYSNYRPITLLSLPPKVYGRVSEKNDTQCRFRSQQLTNLFTLRQDSHTLHHRQRSQRLSDQWQSFALSIQWL